MQLYIINFKVSVTIILHSLQWFCWQKKVFLPFISNTLSILQLITMLWTLWQLEHLTGDSYWLIGKIMLLVVAVMFSWISMFSLLDLQPVNLEAVHIWKHFSGNHREVSKTYQKSKNYLTTKILKYVPNLKPVWFNIN